MDSWPDVCRECKGRIFQFVIYTTGWINPHIKPSSIIIIRKCIGQNNPTTYKPFKSFDTANRKMMLIGA